MDSDAREILDSKAEFRKPSNDGANRKYRRRSPLGGPSSSSDGSPHGDRSSSPIPSRKDISKVSDDKRKRDDDRRQSDRQSSRGYHRHDEHSSRRDKHVDDYDRGYSKPSYRSGRDYRSKDYVNDVDSYSRSHRSREKDSYDRAGHRDRHREDRSNRYGRTDHRKSSPAYEDSRGQRDSGHRLKESSFRDTKEIDENEENKRREDRGVSKEKGPDDESNKSQETVAKKAKLFSMDSTGPGTIPVGTSEKACVTDSDIDAAKIAAMKAAELVNKNLVGTGYMSTDQKKKLLWGNKKKSAPEESAHRWDATIFDDRERQEKFNKLMNLRLRWYHWPIVGCEGSCKGGEQQARQQQQPGCGEAARAASDGIGEAVHGWIAPERRSNCWARSLKCLYSFLFWFVYCLRKLSSKLLNERCVGIAWTKSKVARNLGLFGLIVLHTFFPLFFSFTLLLN